MQWDASAAAGFTTGRPWLPVGADYPEVNVAAERDDPRSLLTLYRRLIQLRRGEPALLAGSYTPAAVGAETYAYYRQAGGRQLLVALNLGPRPQALDAGVGVFRGRVLLSTWLDRAGDEVAGALALRGDEGVVVELNS